MYRSNGRESHKHVSLIKQTGEYRKTVNPIGYGYYNQHTKKRKDKTRRFRRLFNTNRPMRRDNLTTLLLNDKNYARPSFVRR